MKKMKQKSPEVIAKEYKEAYNELLYAFMELLAYVLFWPFLYLFIETDMTLFQAFLYYFLSTFFLSFFIMEIFAYFVIKKLEKDEMRKLTKKNF